MMECMTRFEGLHFDGRTIVPILLQRLQFLPPGVDPGQLRFQ